MGREGGRDSMREREGYIQKHIEVSGALLHSCGNLVAPGLACIGPNCPPEASPCAILGGQGGNDPNLPADLRRALGMAEAAQGGRGSERDRRERERGRVEAQGEQRRDIGTTRRLSQGPAPIQETLADGRQLVVHVAISRRRGDEADRDGREEDDATCSPMETLPPLNIEPLSLVRVERRGHLRGHSSAVLAEVSEVQREAVEPLLPRGDHAEALPRAIEL
ncbi:unnamed protein product [Prorocentrum cordatum]|uniref:Uncharacterized protein n=1 Tax=Prorocentrum cordatum TaxID=2364126 RepID=A0ABN9Q316_9DINO|nr:unnamed protein product [Polarella glacialis]